MKKIIVLVPILYFFSNILIGQSFVHLVDTTADITNNSMSTQLMTKNLIRAAEEDAKYAPVPRVATFDLAFASDLEEFKELSGLGIFYLSTLNQDTAEYPIKRVYVKIKDSYTVELKLIGSLKIPVKDKKIKKVFGVNRIDYYYYLPYILTQMPGEVFIDWSKNRTAFNIGKFPIKLKLDYIEYNDAVKLTGSNEINHSAFSKFAQREFQIEINN